MSEPRRCRAEWPDPDPEAARLRCQGEVGDDSVHIEDHWATLPDGYKIYWTEAVAVYPELQAQRALLRAGEKITAEMLNAARAGQVGGDHYRKFKIQPWDVWEEYDLDPWLANCVKYLLRAGHKGPRVEDLKKARHYLDRAIERAEEE